MENLQAVAHSRFFFHFYIPWKYQKTSGFVMFLGGIGMEK